MIATVFGLFGVVCLFTLLLACSSRYLCAVACRLLQRQSHRLTAARCGCRAFTDAYIVSMAPHLPVEDTTEYDRLERRIFE